jgi:hypothetical protein
MRKWLLQRIVAVDTNKKETEYARAGKASIFKIVTPLKNTKTQERFRATTHINTKCPNTTNKEENG